MGKSSRQKRRTYQTPKRSRTNANFVWYVATAYLVLAGDPRRRSEPYQLGQRYRPGHRRSLACRAGVDDCGKWTPNWLTTFSGGNPSTPVRAGTSIYAGWHSHGDGLIHMEPQSSADTGNHATVGEYFKFVGFKISATSIKFGTLDPSTTVIEKNGDKCGTRPGVLRWAVNGKQKKGNPGKYKLNQGDVIELVFSPPLQPIPPKTQVPSFDALEQVLGIPTSPTTPPTGKAAPTTVVTSPTNTTAQIDDDRGRQHSPRHESGRPRRVARARGCGRSRTRRRSRCSRSRTSRSSSASSPGSRAHGVDEVVLSLGYLPDAFERALPRRPLRRRAAARTRSRSKPLGTAGRHPLRRRGASTSASSCATATCSPTSTSRAMVAFHEASGAEATIALTAGRGLRRRSAWCRPAPTARSSASSRSRPPDRRRPTGSTPGTYVLEPSASSSAIPPRVNVSIERETFPRMVETRGRLFAFSSDGYWLDIGTPAKYLEAHADVLGGRARAPARARCASRDPPVSGCRATSIVDPDARAGRARADRRRRADRGRATVGASVIGPGAAVGTGARVEASVLHAGAGSVNAAW